MISCVRQVGSSDSQLAGRKTLDAVVHRARGLLALSTAPSRWLCRIDPGSDHRAMDHQSRRLRDVGELPEAIDRVVSLARLREAGVTRGRRRAHVAAERWQHLPHRGVVLDHGPLGGDSGWRAALLHVGTSARLGGVTALQASGLTGFEETPIHIWVTKSTRKGRPAGVVLHESRRWGDDDAAPHGIPRARPAVAAVQAALWARTPRQAAYLLVLPVQQRLVSVEDLGVEMSRVRRHAYRGVLSGVVADIGDGVRSMNELDFARLCRARGLPEPSRQTLRESAQGRRYLDVEWVAYDVRLEVQGAGHARLLNVLSDDVRLMDLAAEDGAAVSVSVLSLRVDPEPLFASLARLLQSRGWRGAYRPPSP